MSGLAYLATRHALRRWGRSLVLVLSVAVALALPATSRVLVARYDEALHARAATTPLVVGAKGSRFDLVFAALYYRSADLGTTTVGRYEWLLREQGIEAIPVHARFTVRGDVPVVATTVEYFERRGLLTEAGRRPALLSECVLGASVSQRLGLRVGDELYSDQRRALDITSAQSIRLPVVGVLAETGTPDDEAVFVDLETAWVLEGATHGHTPAERVEGEGLVIGESDQHIALANALREAQEITPANASNFHLHGERRDLPLTAVLVWPDSDKTRTIVGERVNRSDGDQAVVPSRVIDDLMAFVVRVRTVFDALAIVLLASTAVLIGLIVALSYRVREAELQTLGEIGASRFAVAQLFGLELAGLVVLAVVVAAGLAGVSVLVVSSVYTLV